MVNAPKDDIALDKNSMEPLFAQVEKSLSAAITAGRFLPGERIPTEPELADMYGVSRITIRRAIDELCQHGMLVKRPLLITDRAALPGFREESWAAALNK